MQENKHMICPVQLINSHLNGAACNKNERFNDESVLIKEKIKAPYKNKAFLFSTGARLQAEESTKS